MLYPIELRAPSLELYRLGGAAPVAAQSDPGHDRAAMVTQRPASPSAPIALIAVAIVAALLGGAAGALLVLARPAEAAVPLATGTPPTSTRCAGVWNTSKRNWGRPRQAVQVAKGGAVPSSVERDPAAGGMNSVVQRIEAVYAGMRHLANNRLRRQKRCPRGWRLRGLPTPSLRPSCNERRETRS